jgi:hypothetical protein
LARALDEKTRDRTGLAILANREQQTGGRSGLLYSYIAQVRLDRLGFEEESARRRRAAGHLPKGMAIALNYTR